MHFELLVDELKSTTGRIDKENILSKYIHDVNENFIHLLLREAFDPNLLHHVVLKKKDIPSAGTSMLLDKQLEVLILFDVLHRELSPVKNRDRILELMEELTEESQLALFGVVNKRLQCGVSIKTLNKVSEDFIDVTPIALAKSYDPEKSSRYSNQFYCSKKLDGQRIFCLRDVNGKWSKHARAGDYLGNEVTTLDHWDRELEHFYKFRGINFIDGEAYKHGMTFEEISSLVSSSVNVKDATILEYHVFFAGKTLDLKSSAKENSILGAKPDTLYDTLKQYRYLEGVKQAVITNDESIIYEEIDDAVAKGYEGAMLRSIDVWYDFKRSNNLLKAKKSELSGTVEHTDAYVEDIEYGEFPVREEGIESIEYLPVALWVVLPNDESTKQMKIGSGFSLDDRRRWASDESLIVSKTVEVEFQGFGAQGRMRFPRYLRIRSDLL